jgi:hypothetical protein
MVQEKFYKTFLLFYLLPSGQEGEFLNLNIVLVLWADWRMCWLFRRDPPEADVGPGGLASLRIEENPSVWHFSTQCGKTSRGSSRGNCTHQVTTLLNMSHIFVFLGRTGVWTQGVTLAKPALYHLGHSSSLFCSGCFGDGISETICLGWRWFAILLISASQVTRITGMNHGTLLEPYFEHEADQYWVGLCTFIIWMSW